MSDHTITQLLGQWKNGRPQALNGLIDLVYDELRRIGRYQMQGEGGSRTLQSTALVHEAYLRLQQLRNIDWRDRRHFFVVASGIMRRVLVDQARKRASQKRGGEAERVTLDVDLPAPQETVDIAGLDSALKRLAERDASLAQIVELRYFGGLTVDETAAAMSIAPATVKRKWTLARTWLYRELHDR